MASMPGETKPRIGQDLGQDSVTIEVDSPDKSQKVLRGEVLGIGYRITAGCYKGVKPRRPLRRTTLHE